MDYRLVAAFAISALFDILLPVVVALWIRRRFHTPWKYLGFGALVFFVSQVVLRIPAITIIQSFLTPYLRDSVPLQIGWILVLSLTAGLFEEVGRYLGYRYLFKDGKTWPNALMYGVGHGGLESILLGGLAMLSSLASYIVLSNMDLSQVPASQAAQIQQAKDVFANLAWWMPFLGAFERAGALAIQISLSVVVLQCFLRGNLNWLWLAIGYHAFVDFAAVMVARYFGPIAAEGVVAVFAAFSLYLVFRLRGSPQAAEVS